MRNECNITPLGDRVAVVREEPVGKSKGGILLPDVAKEQPKRGKVVAVGKGTRNRDGVWFAPEIDVGQTVAFLAYAGKDVKVDDKEYLVLNVADVVAVVE
jgi:chaperonin GroES